MKKATILLIAIGMGFSNCKTSKPAATAVSTEQQQLAYATNRWPGTTLEQLNEGSAIMNNQCSRCHGTKKIANYTEEKWEKEINKMAPKAKITDIQKENLRRYILTLKGLETK